MPDSRLEKAPASEPAPIEDTVFSCKSFAADLTGYMACDILLSSSGSVLTAQTNNRYNALQEAAEEVL